MASCTFYRVCTDNTSSGKYAAQMIYDPVGNDLLIVWSENRVFDLSTGNGFRFTRFNLDTLSPHDEVAVAGNFTSDQYYTPLFTIDPAGIYVVTFTNGNLAKVSGVESSDSGATWGAVTSFTTASAGVSRNKGLASNGTSVIAIGSQPSSQIGDVYSYTRTGANTWAAGVKIFTHNNGGAPGVWDTTAPPQAPEGSVMFDALNGLCVGFRTVDGETTSMKRLTAMTTTDAFATQTPVTIDTFAASEAGGAVHLVKTSTDRVYILYHDPDASEIPNLAYTDDMGATWTLLGVPAIVTSTCAGVSLSNWDNQFDSFLSLDGQENVLFGFSTLNLLVGTEHHFVFRGTDVAADYVLAGDCTYTIGTAQWLTNSTGHAVAVGNTLYRLCTLSKDEGEAQDSAELHIFVVEGAPIPEEGEPLPLVAQAPAFSNNMVYRKDLARGLGWSLHAIPVAFFMPWGEGDRETGRERPILLYASTNIDPTQQPLALLPVLSRIETDLDDGYGDRVYTDLDDLTVVQYDPRRMIVKSKVFAVVNDYSWVILRAGLCSYRCHNPAGVQVQIWSDDHLVDTTILPYTGNLMETATIDLPTDDNEGRTYQFVVDETSNYGLDIDSFGLVYIVRGRRGDG